MDDDKPMLEHLRETNERLAAGPPVDFDPAVHGEFLYPIAWLNRYCERTSSQFRVESCAIAQVDVLPNDWIAPVAWAIDLAGLDEAALASSVIMCGAEIGGLNQFSFQGASWRTVERADGIPVEQLGTVKVNGYPCAPACCLGVFGPGSLGRHLVVLIGNRRLHAVSGNVTVWGKNTTWGTIPSSPCGR